MLDKLIYLHIINIMSQDEFNENKLVFQQDVRYVDPLVLPKNSSITICSELLIVQQGPQILQSNIFFL